MIRHLFIAALRNIAANKLLSAISILGLSVGIAAALLMGLVIRNQLSFDHFIHGYERTYLAIQADTPSGLATWYFDQTSDNIAALLKLNDPGIESIARLIPAKPGEYSDKSVELKRDEIAARETIYWADPNIFDVLPLPVYRGDLRSALRQTDGIVLSRSIARKYFGQDDAVGGIILVAGHPMTVRAIVQDLPTYATELQSGIFVSGLAAKLKDAHGRVNTYLRLKPGASITALEQNLPRLIASIQPNHGQHLVNSTILLLRLDKIPLFDGLYPGAKERLIMAGLVGLLILLIASVNFVNLLTAHSTRRSAEVGVRKVCGAGRRQLILQFLCESIVSVFFATCVAVALCEWLLPSVNAFLSTGAILDYWRSPTLIFAIVLGIGVLGLAASVYPAFVLSAFRPVSAIRGLTSRSTSANVIRSMLVSLQFAILIALLIGSAVVYQQRVYATREGLRANIDQMLVVKGACRPAFRTELRKLPGVAGASCSDGDLVNNGSRTDLHYKNRTALVDIVSADWGTFALYGINPVAGSLVTRLPHGDYDTSAADSIILNLAAMKRLGIASPQAAVGQYVSLDKPLRIAAIVPDFAFYSVERSMEPTIYRPYVSAPANYTLVSVKLKGQQIPETLAAIDRLWNATGNVDPIRRSFLNQQMAELYLNMTRRAEMFAIFSGIAVILACLGLIGIAVATAERRTKEIGIRKTMGATNAEILVLLLFQFSKPVLLANIIAWPIAWWQMRRWLSGFAYHVELQWWVFAAVSLGALLVALLTVAGQAWLAARQKPVLALRYE